MSRADRGAVAAEYAVLLTMVAVGLVTAMLAWAGAVQGSVNAAANVIDSIN